MGICLLLKCHNVLELAQTNLVRLKIFRYFFEILHFPRVQFWYTGIWVALSGNQGLGPEFLICHQKCNYS
jgi:hypothetical protein